jgi:hypothetical protein
VQCKLDATARTLNFNHQTLNFGRRFSDSILPDNLQPEKNARRTAKAVKATTAYAGRQSRCAFVLL